MPLAMHRALWHRREMRPLPSSLVAIMLAVTAPGQALAKDATLTARTIDGARFSLADQRDKVVIVNFWATWCVPCRVEMPALDAYFRRHRADGLAMIAISVDAGASAGKLAKATRGFAFPVASLDDTHIARSALPAALPATRIYGRDGTLRFDSVIRATPPLDEATIARIVGPLLAEATRPTR